MQVNKKQAGVLLHPTSLPNSAGKLGQLNEQAWLFLEWMQQAKLCIWQTLPLTHTHEDLSPYQALSAFALNPALLPDNWLEHFDQAAFEAYLLDPPHWLDDYALFVAIRNQQKLASWVDWPNALKMHDKTALDAFAKTHPSQVTFLKQQQFVLQTIWSQLKQDANDKGIKLFGDIPIFVAFDSADVWANPDQFKLDENHCPTVVTGVPPDYFSETGQRWGNPHYDWDRMQQDGFAWWRKRMAASLEQFDMVRIDHFRGLESSWEIQASEETAMNGTWEKVPGEALLKALQQDFPDLPIVAEDLGIITEEVVALKNQFNLPGMSVLQFGFNGLPDNPHSIYEQVANSVTYTGTHDNDTSVGWFESLDDGAKNWIMELLMPITITKLKQAGLPTSMPWPLIVAGLSSAANSVIIPMQDWLALGSEHRMNTPGTPEHNWRWQLNASQVPADLAEKIAVLIEQSKRCQYSK
ncbi:MAG: 4-alpha-glucanotransferase [Thiotrichales bacterium]|nr:4-alpha-glucanotransferase [Thiotrichales bacterium]